MSTIERNKEFLTDLFTGPFRGHGFILSAPKNTQGPLGDFAVTDIPVREYVPVYVKSYEAALRYHEGLGDDSVPYVNMNTNTGIFASAFGCGFHVYQDRYSTNACALPCIETIAEAEALPEGDLGSPALARFFELAGYLREELGPDVPISVPDIQSPFDIAALIWKKEEMMPAMIEAPEAVHSLVAKCNRLLQSFLDTFIDGYGEVNLCHCPEAWAPKELGIWLSEDEIGAFSAGMFEEFCLPVLTDLSNKYGGMFMHCCAEADHQYGGFLKIPNLRALNRVWTSKGPKPAIDLFAGKLVLMPAWLGEQGVYDLMAMANPDNRFLFNLAAMPLDEAKAVHDRLRERYPRVG